ncbi:HelD family protein [Nocardiopsis sediminis]|uniref:HelD family protein n=1 Tax=Nocardiopsis sediminis TaxID=1778267 RepID=A0ABV8FPC8_9ACTN
MPDPARPVDPEIRAERAHLAAAREALRRMREDVLTTRTAVGDAVVDKYTNAVLRRSRALRAEHLADLPDVPLFFGRLDFPPGTVHEDAPGTEEPGTDVAPGPRPDDAVHIGRRNVHDAAGTTMVIDWRAPIAGAFYRASPREPMGVRRRRRYGFDGARLTAYEDEPLAAAGPAADGRPISGLLAAEIERPRSGPMRDIVATIQPDQDDLVRAPLDRVVCVQGAPGTGKTAVGLHRVAYLLYMERERLGRAGAVVIGPNRAFLDYIRNVLPALGELGVAHTTIDDLLGRVEVRRAEEPDAARIKGDARMAEVIRRDLWSRLRPPAETLVVRTGARRWRLYPDELAALADEVRGRGVPYGAGRGLFAGRVARALLARMEEAGWPCDDRTLTALGRDRDVRAAVAEVWPACDPARLVLGLLTDPGRLARAADGVLDPGEQAALALPGRQRTAAAARWSDADLALIDEAAGLIERPAALGHVVVDEAQDLSPMQCRAIGRRLGPASATVLGDLAQATHPAAVPDWPALLHHLGAPDAAHTELVRGYRVPEQIIGFAARLLKEIAPTLREPEAVRSAPGSLRVTAAGDGGLRAAAVRACTEALAGEGAVGLIAADGDIADLHGAVTGAGVGASLLGADDGAMGAQRLVCVPASLAKGLEFDAVVVAEPARIAGSGPRGAHRLYIALTRAVSTLHVVHAAPLPEPLR